MKLVTLTIDDHIARVTLNRPDKLNALNLAMFQQLDEIINTLAKDRTVRAVILDANGEDFSTGLDVKSVMKSGLSIVKLLWKWLPGNQNLAQRVVLGWQRLPMPVIAVINGRCWGGGTQLILGADYRIAHHDASFAIMEARWGLAPDMGASLPISHLIARDQALLLSSLAEPFTSSDALKLGLITQCDAEPLKAAYSLAQSLIIRSPDTLSAIKRLYQTSYGQATRKTLARETFNQVRLLLNKNTRIAINNQLNSQDSPFHKAKKW
ncbi:crotonase/enoyl-CoA hydratase family protein [Pseudoalteromonas ulvae]|uniref:Enoyl-CoA hydratase n=1 Tax=Pseudoalteromonas ulvae TaxID=107327 RepID=A0A244CSR4_PSEDV|nr:crotonase/enoyl-CoA hydratase family protein [Pseudoalteromonas ulvae]OUL58644.1 enoyl-CoA hydratase [Pseudoalteromonas ulvae]